MRLGTRHPNVADLRRRLALVGDLDVTGITDICDLQMEAVVRRFRARHGFNVDGIVREQTLRGLNMPAAVRISQLKINLARCAPSAARAAPDT